MPSFDGTVAPPRVVSIENTRFCNLRCPMCEFVDLGTVATGPHMPIADFRRIVAGLPDGVERVQLTVTGEPLLARDLDQMIACVHEHGLRLDVLTNGMLLQGPVLDLLLPVLGRLQVSFDGATKATFEAIRVRSDFERVCRNVRNFCARANELPVAQRPQVGLECTIMRDNIDELPAIVDLGADLGVHRIAVHHVHPFVERLREQSLAHHVERAERSIEQAMQRARARSLPISVEAIGQVIADTANATGDTRVARLDEHASASARLPAKSHGFETMHPVPMAPRTAARLAASAPAQPAADVAQPDAIGTCQYLWERAEISIEGNVRACCVAGAPLLGNVQRDDFARIWNGPVYRTMRAGIVAQDPVAFCKGCQYLRVVTDPAQIRARLGDRAVPRKDQIEHFEPVAWGSPTLSGVAVAEHTTAPTLRWAAHAEAEGYDVEFSSTDFAQVQFSTAWHKLQIAPSRASEATFAVPAWVWEQAPTDHKVFWRAIAWIGGNCVELAVGAVRRVSTSG